MKAVRLYKPTDLRVEEIDIPSINDNEVLVKVMAVGVCGSDIPRVNKYGAHVSPITIGHEFSGEIIKVGADVNGFHINDRVTVPPLIPCFNCNWCQSGLYSLCDNYDYYGSRRDGAMAQYIAVKQENLIKVSNNVNFEDAATVDPCANAIHALLQGKFVKDDTLCIYGTGPIGLYAIQYAKALGATKILAVDILDEKLELAKNLGANYVLNSKNTDPVKWVYDITGGRGCDLVIDMSGVPNVQHDCILSATKEGRVVFLGISHSDLKLSAEAVDFIQRKQLHLIGSWNSFSHPFPGREWTEAVKLFEEGKLSSKGMISHKYGLDEAPNVFARIRDGNFAYNKIMFFPWGQE